MYLQGIRDRAHILQEIVFYVASPLNLALDFMTEPAIVFRKFEFAIATNIVTGYLAIRPVVGIKLIVDDRACTRIGPTRFGVSRKQRHKINLHQRMMFEIPGGFKRVPVGFGETYVLLRKEDRPLIIFIWISRRIPNGTSAVIQSWRQEFKHGRYNTGVHIGKNKWDIFLVGEH